MCVVGCGVCLLLIMCMVCDWVWCVCVVQLGMVYIVQLIMNHMMYDVCLQLGVMCVWYGLVCNWAWCVLMFSACLSTFPLVSSLHAAPSFLIVLLWSGVLRPGQL